MTARSDRIAMSDKPLILAPGHRLQWEEAQGTDVLLYPGGVVTLSPSAAAVLKQCDGKDFEAVIAALEQQFPGAELREEVVAFLDEARRNGWLYSD